MPESKNQPTQAPPQDGGSQVSTLQQGEEARPKPLTEAQMAQSAMGDEAATAPSQTPPAAGAESTSGGGDGVTASTWRSGTVTALWAQIALRNAYMHVPNVGWKKIFNGRDGAFQALTYLASQARQGGRTIGFREESDGMVYEIYLW